MLQLIRSSAYLLAQQLFPRAHVQLRESFTCQIRVVLVELRVILEVVQEANGSVPYDQLFAAHPHVHNMMYTVRIHCVDGCIAKCVQNSKTNPSQQTTARLRRHLLHTFAKLGAYPSDGQRSHHVRQKMATCVPFEVRAHMQKSPFLVKQKRFLNQARTLWITTLDKRKHLRNTMREITNMCRLLIAWVVTETNW